MNDRIRRVWRTARHFYWAHCRACPCTRLVNDDWWLELSLYGWQVGFVKPGPKR